MEGCWFTEIILSKVVHYVNFHNAEFEKNGDYHTIHFNGNLSHYGLWLLINRMVKVVETFTDIS